MGGATAAAAAGVYSRDGGHGHSVTPETMQSDAHGSSAGHDSRTVDDIAAATGTALEQFPHLVFGFLFGSAVAGRLRLDSDVDVAVYEASQGRLEVEAWNGSRIWPAACDRWRRCATCLPTNIWSCASGVSRAWSRPGPMRSARSPGLRGPGCATGTRLIPRNPPDPGARRSRRQGRQVPLRPETVAYGDAFGPAGPVKESVVIRQTP